MVAIRWLCAAAALVVLVLFIGGLAYSIWDNTESIAFPIIVGIVLLMAFAAFLGDLRSGKDL